MIEVADYLEEHSRLVFLLYRRHSGEDGPVLPHGLVAGRARGLSGIDQHELAALSVAALAVTDQALAGPHLCPDLILEKIVHGGGASHNGLSRFIVAMNGGRTSDSGSKAKDKQASISEHDAPDTGSCRIRKDRG
jgi:hypothetical protein